MIVRRDSKITEGSTVSVNYVSASSARIEKMELSKRSLPAGSHVLIVDDFMKGGGTVNGMRSLIKEFDAELVGISVFAEGNFSGDRMVTDYTSLIRVDEVDTKANTLHAIAGNYLAQNQDRLHALKKMSAYLIPIKSEVIAFPFIALFVSLPFMVGQYRKYGSFLFWRAVVLYSFVFYLLAAYFMIMLPLPSRASVAALTTPRYNLVPFSALRTFLATTVFSPFHPGTWLVALRQPGFIQPAFNLVLTLPFGVYLRYYFKRSLPQVMVMTFGLSLFFELTQLSGLYGIYPRPYRLFDVDDLIINTTGGVLGGLLAPALMRAFPTREEMDRKSYAQGARVTWLRRFVAFVIDNVVGVGLTVLVMTLLARLFDLTSPLLTWLINAVFAPLVVFVLSRCWRVAQRWASAWSASAWCAKMVAPWAFGGSCTASFYSTGSPSMSWSAERRVC